jgi:hypothetical protein
MSHPQQTLLWAIGLFVSMALVAWVTWMVT